MVSRRGFVLSLALCAAFASLAGRPAAGAAQPTVEIIALSHWPVQDALKPVYDFLGTVTGRVTVVKLDAESPEGEKRLSALGLRGHVPMLLLINGSDRFNRPDGTAVEFKDFPANTGNPLGLNGSWTVADFEAAIKTALDEPEK